MHYNGYNLETLFRTFFHMYMSCVKKEFRKRGLTPVGNPGILFLLRHKSENMVASQREIADKLGISAPTVAVSIKRMDKAGLVHKVADETDLRRNLITLTESGCEFVDGSKTAFDAVYKHMFQGLSKQDQEQLRTLFLRIITNLATMGAKPPEDLEK